MLQIRSDLRLALSSRRKMFIMHLVRTLPEYRGGCRLIAGRQRHQADRHVEQQQRRVLFIRAVLDDVGRTDMLERRD